MEKFKGNNVGQCWQCKRQIGEKILPIYGKFFRLPDCSAMDKYMTHVYEVNCPSFQHK